MPSMRPFALIAGNCAIAIAIRAHDNTSIKSTMAPMNFRWRMVICSTGWAIARAGALTIWSAATTTREHHECSCTRTGISPPRHQDLASGDRGARVRDGHGAWAGGGHTVGAFDCGVETDQRDAAALKRCRLGGGI